MTQVVRDSKARRGKRRPYSCLRIHTHTRNTRVLSPPPPLSLSFLFQAHTAGCRPKTQRGGRRKSKRGRRRARGGESKQPDGRRERERNNSSNLEQLCAYYIRIRTRTRTERKKKGVNRLEDRAIMTAAHTCTTAGQILPSVSRREERPLLLALVLLERASKRDRRRILQKAGGGEAGTQYAGTQYAGTQVRKQGERERYKEK